MSWKGNGPPDADSAAMGGSAARRVFWLGNHRLLIGTELPRLQALGFEVFRPPCRSTQHYHQSATTDWEEFPTTLPADVYAELVATDFYYRSLDAEVFELLNRHFGAVIVTIEAGWLVELARGYRGRLIYRTYGHVFSSSDQLWSLGAFRAVTEHPDFRLVPHAEEQARLEQAWLRRREAIVPYCVDSAIEAAQGSWTGPGSRREIMLHCPNIAGNPGFARHYAEIEGCFKDPAYRFYGLQTGPVADPRVVGTIPFEQVLESYRRAAGLLYTYRDPGVCFLPPIEMMIIGGPVVFLEGSLLCRYMPGDAPGRARDLLEARAKCQRLLDGDAAFSAAIVATQAAVCRRYLPSSVWPEFDAAFRRLLDPASPAPPAPIGWVASSPEGERPDVVALAHAPALAPRFSDGRYTTDDPRVVRLINVVRAAFGPAAGRRLVVTCQHAALPAWHGLFARYLPDVPVLLHAVDAELPRRPPSPYAARGGRGLAALARGRAGRLLPAAVRSGFGEWLRRGLERLESTRRSASPPHVPAELLEASRVIALDPRCEDGVDATRLIRLHAEPRSDSELSDVLRAGQR